ncbi:MAG: aldehyde ferredoxin oxidoreductase N-terminal domain-containing protein, partial [Promethearchaeota archaeon]
MSDSAMSYIDSKILRVSLSESTITTESIPEDLYRNYLGGRGLGVKILYDTLSPGIDALSPENLLVFAIGPLTAMPVPTAGRLEVITKSPLTGTIFDSNVGGYIGAQLRRAGYAAIIFEGAATKP